MPDNPSQADDIDNRGVIACIDCGAISRHVIDRASKFSRQTGGNLYVIYVQTDSPAHQFPHQEQAVSQLLSRAEQNGGIIIHQTADCLQDGLMDALDDLSPPPESTLFIGGPTGSKLFCKFRTTIYDILADQWPGIQVNVVEYPDRFSKVRNAVKNLGNFVTWRAVGVPALITLFLGAGMGGMHFFGSTATPQFLEISSMAIIFLFAGLVAGRFFGLVGALAQTVLATICLIFIGIIGDGQLAMAQGVQIGLYAITGGMMAYLYGGTKYRSKKTATREKRIKVLYRVGRNASRYNDRRKVLQILHQGFEENTDLTIGFFLPSKDGSQGGKERFEWYPPDLELSDDQLAEMHRCYDDGLSTQVGSVDDDPFWRFEPMVTANGILGVIGVHLPDAKMVTPSFDQFIAALADQAAISLERAAITDEIEKAQIREEREKLRVLLLSSVSHDLKTPLSSIIGSLSSLKMMGDRLPMESKNILIDTALEEAERLNQFITNILNMTRLESGDIDFDQEWVDPENIIDEVAHRLRHALIDHDLNIDIEQDVLIRSDPTLLTQVIQNMMDNAIKYSPSGSQIQLVGEKAGDQYQIFILDEGQGIDDDQRHAVFDKYERLRHTDSNKAGTGLGLAICRAIMEAQGGQADVITNQDLQHHENDRLSGHAGGAFRLIFPEIKKQTMSNGQ